jgi:hypothetical protein
VNGCRYEHEDRKCYRPDQLDPEFGPDWCVEGPCHLKESDVMEYIKKPVVVEAFRLGFDNIPDWFMDKVTDRTATLLSDREVNDPFDHDHKTMCDIQTLEGVMRGNHGDFIIKGVNGELYPCKPNIFQMTYEPVKTKAIDAKQPYDAKIALDSPALEQASAWFEGVVRETEELLDKCTPALRAELIEQKCHFITAIVACQKIIAMQAAMGELLASVDARINDKSNDFLN